MNKIILTLIVVAVIGAAAFSGFFTPPKEKGNIPATATNTSCLDESAPIEHQKILFDRLPGEKELHVIKGAIHSPWSEDQLTEFETIFNQWIKKLQ